jgi:uncharacterized protein YndB with AHSA1/START domain
MRNIHVSRQLDAPREAIWAVLADFHNIYIWNSGVKASHDTGDGTIGLGAQRHCELAPLGTLKETIAEWHPNEKLVVSIDSATKLPIENGAATFTLSDHETAIDYAYRPKGIVGKVMGPILDRQLRKGFGGFLDDLEKAAQQQPVS